MRKVILCLFLSALCGQVFADKGPSKALQSKKPSFESLAESNVLVRTGAGSGSGFFFTSSLLVTSYHVVQKAMVGSEGLKTVLLENQRGKQDAGLVVAEDRKNDLAIIKALKSDYKPMPLGTYEDVKIGDDIFLYGSPKGYVGTLSKGIVSAKRQFVYLGELLQIDASALKGSSGSPVLSKDHKVIGVLRMGPADTLNFAVPITYLHQLIEQNKEQLVRINALNFSDSALSDIIRRIRSRASVTAKPVSFTSQDLLNASAKGDLLKVQALIKAGANVNVLDNDGRTALIYASMFEHLEVAQALIKAGANLNIQQKYGWTALMKASMNGHLEIAQALIKAGADLNLQTKKGGTALMHTSLYGHLEVAQALIRARADVNHQNKYGKTVLMWASKGGHLGVAQALIRARADLNLQDKEGVTALMDASQKGHIEIAQALIKARADLNLQDKYGWTALMFASQEGHLGVAQALIRARADLNLQNKDGGTALIYASFEGHLKVAQTLIKAGANVKAQDKDGRTALMIASLNGHLEIAQALIKAGANLNIQDKMVGWTALMIASDKGHTEIADLIQNALTQRQRRVASKHNKSLKKANLNKAFFKAVQLNYLQKVLRHLTEGANIDIQTKKGRTALMVASKEGYIEIVKTLINKGANVHIQSKKGHTALFFASANGHLEVVQALVEAGADVNTQDHKGRTALDMATKHHHIQAFLKKHTRQRQPASLSKDH